MTLMPTVKGHHRKRNHTPSNRSALNRYLKKQVAKARRRAEKKDLENVPVRLTRGYAD